MRQSSKAKGFLSRLARDKCGNTLVIMAAIMIPLCAFSGSAIDMARLYVVKARLQQACDAGVLAGRRFMTDTTDNGTLDTTATTQANAFFVNNFRSGWFTTSVVSFTPAKVGGTQVSGTATATVPMTIMKMFGKDSQVLNVSCQARYDVADTDVMMVLDVTGSMSCLPSDSTTCSTTAVSYTRPDGSTDYYNPEKSGSKLQAVRDAVQSFYETLAASVDTSTHIRYGFVPYASTVNAGAAVYGLSTSYFVSSWNYQSRIRNTTNPENSSTSTATKNNSSTTACAAYASARSPASGYDSTGSATMVTSSLNNNNKCTITTTTYTPNWTYTQTTWPVSSYLATINGGTITDPTKVTGDTTAWQGCIEERNTTSGISSTTGYDINNLPPDLDPDLIPSSDATRWRPTWPDVEYGRSFSSNSYAYTSTNNVNSTGENTTSPDNSNNWPSTPNLAGYNMLNGGFSVCPQAASRLTTMTEAQVMTYVNALKAHGGTYHDIGMIWGTRMLSPNGIFKADTQAWSGHDVPQRVIVFLTDGAMAPDLRSYSSYGMEYFDQRVMGNNTSTLADYHNARFLTECAKAKAENMSVWVVAVGQSLTTPLQQCATNTNQALYANSSATLTAAFKTIANSVAMLRIVK